VANERLRSCITGARLTISDVAAQVGVDPKTVERWIVPGRVPHRSHRWATASLLGTDEAYLWPEIANDRRTRAASAAELVTLYPNRGAVPGTLWRSLLDGAADRIDVLVFSGLFLPDGYPEVAKLFVAKAQEGVKLRLAMGNPDSDAVRLRGEEERIGDGLAARVRLSLTYLRDAMGAPGIELRFHATTLYNSIYRFDDDMLVNAHVYGAQLLTRRCCTYAVCRVVGCSTTTRPPSSESGSRPARTAWPTYSLSGKGGNRGSDRLLQRSQRPQGQQHRPLGNRHRA
jgi:hypothetical protein